MELREAARRRRMVRSFREQPVAREQLDRILDLARRVPSAGFTQGTEMLVLHGPEETARYWDAALPAGRRGTFPWPGLLRAPVLVVVLASAEAYLDRYAEADKGWTERDEQRWPVPYWDVDAGFAAMMLLLGTVDEGLGACFFGVFEGWPRIAEAFGVPERFHPVGVVALGHPADDDRPSSSVSRGRRPLDEIVHRGHW